MILFVDSRFLSPYAMSAYVALKEKRVDFELKTLDLIAGAQHEARYAKASITHRIPTLVDGEFWLSESSAIDEYVDEVYPGQRLYPVEPKARARARQIQAWLRSDLMPVREERSAEVIFHPIETRPLSEAGRGAARKLFEGALALLSQGGEHLFGAWSIADTDLSFMLQRLVRGGDEVPPALADYARRQWERPSIQEWRAIKRADLPGAVARP
jgi:glutathione S-transferase